MKFFNNIFLEFFLQWKLQCFFSIFLQWNFLTMFFTISNRYGFLDVFFVTIMGLDCMTTCSFIWISIDSFWAIWAFSLVLLESNRRRNSSVNFGFFITVSFIFFIRLFNFCWFPFAFFTDPFISSHRFSNSFVIDSNVSLWRRFLGCKELSPSFRPRVRTIYWASGGYFEGCRIRCHGSIIYW